MSGPDHALQGDALAEALEGDMKASLGVFLLDGEGEGEDGGEGLHAGGSEQNQEGPPVDWDQHLPRIGSVRGLDLHLEAVQARGVLRAAAGALRGYLREQTDRVLGEWDRDAEAVSGGVTSAMQYHGVTSDGAAEFRVALGTLKVLETSLDLLTTRHTAG